MEPNEGTRSVTSIIVGLTPELLRETLCSFLSCCKGLRVQAAVGTLADLRAAVEHSLPDLVILSINLPDGSGLGWVEGLKMRHPQVKVLFLTNDRSPESMLAASATGAEGYLVTDTSCGRLVEAISSLAHGECAFDPSVAVAALRLCAASRLPGHPLVDFEDSHGLSVREKEVAALASVGCTNDEIAERLFVSVNTVKTHLRRIFRRLGISSRRELLRDIHLPPPDVYPSPLSEPCVTRRVA